MNFDEIKAVAYHAGAVAERERILAKLRQLPEGALFSRGDLLAILEPAGGLNRDETPEIRFPAYRHKGCEGAINWTEPLKRGYCLFCRQDVEGAETELVEVVIT